LIPSSLFSDPLLSASAMLYLVDGIQSFTFLDAVVRFLLPLSTMDDYRSNILDPPAMDPKPPDRSSLPTPPVPSRDPPLPLTLLGPTHSPSSPHQTTPSNEPSPPSELDLVRSLEALQVSSPAAQSSRCLAEETLSTWFNILVKVADPLGTAHQVSEHSARMELDRPSRWDRGSSPRGGNLRGWMMLLSQIQEEDIRVHPT
jgi:hypothetical protein